jgi:reactive intermediate/imine deaminase
MCRPAAARPRFKTPARIGPGVKRTISTDDAPAAVGAYSQATTDGDVLITAGQLPLTTDGELLSDESVAEQTRQCLRNVEAILESEGLSLENVLKTTVFLADIDDFDEFNEAYGEFFQNDPPARSAVGAGEIPKGAAVEIEAIATAPE